MCAYYRPTMYKESLYASPSEKELAIQKKKSQQLDLRDSYLRQMEEARQRKKLQKLLDKADDLIYLQTEKNFSPWGRGGGGAPLRDDMGDVISDLNAVYSGERQPVNEPLSPNRKNILQAAGAAVSGSDRMNRGQSSILISPVKAYKQKSPEFDQYERNAAKSNLLNTLSHKLEQHHKSTASAFLDIDEDRSGYIDVEELSILCKKYNLPLGQVREVVQRCDVDRNGLISFSEFAKQLRYVDSNLDGEDTIIAPRLQRKDRYSPRNTNNLSPKGVLMKGMPVGLKAGEKRLILMDTPRSSEQRRRERHRDRLKRDLDAQVALKKSLKRQEEEENFAEDLQWQQNLVEKGLDYWGRPIPEGDPRGTARLMAQNTLEKLETSGLSPKEVADKAGRRKRNRQGSPGLPDNEETKNEKSVPFMGSLHAMYANPDEEMRMKVNRNRLKSDLASQVAEQKSRRFEEEYHKRREELESRQKKIAAGLDHWGQPIAAGDPYRIADKMRKEIKEMEANLKQMAENERAEGGTEAAIANYGRTTSNPRTQRVSNSDTIEFQKNRNNSLASDNFEISLDDELDKFMTPRDVREKMILSQMVGVEQKEALEAQDREKGRVAYFDNTNPNKSNTPSTESDKSFVGLLNDKLYDMIKGAMWNEAYLRRLFQRFDVDNTGKISATNFRRVFSKLGLTATKSEISELLKRLDPQRRGTIDYLGFIKICVVNAKTKRANQLYKEKKKKRDQKKLYSPEGPRGKYGRYRNDQRISSKQRHQKQRQIAWEDGMRSKPTGRYRASSQYPKSSQKDIDAKKLEQLVSLTKRLLKEQADLRDSLARTNEALGVSI